MAMAVVASVVKGEATEAGMAEEVINSEVDMEVKEDMAVEAIKVDRATTMEEDTVVEDTPQDLVASEEEAKVDIKGTMTIQCL